MLIIKKKKQQYNEFIITHSSQGLGITPSGISTRLWREVSRLFLYQKHLAGWLYVSKLDYMLLSSKNIAASTQKLDSSLGSG